MTLNEILLNILAMREDLLMFERKYGVPTEIFFEAYTRGEEPSEQAWVLDWAQWAGTYKILCELLEEYHKQVHKVFASTTITNFSDLIKQTARHEPIAIPG